MTNDAMNNGQLKSISRHLACVLACALIIGHSPRVTAADWLPAAPGHTYQFPRDHLPHAGFKTEWWYFTGNVRDAGGRRFGYQLTFFRQGLRPPGASVPGQSRFIVDDLKFAHFAITDVTDQRFHFQQRISRGAFGEAGFESASALAWIEGWRLTQQSDGSFAIEANNAEGSIKFTLGKGKRWTIHGKDGISQKADGAGHASHYYSGTRMPTAGQLTVRGRTYEVKGETWFDHEWATNQLTPEQVGWDWFSLQFEDGTELMLYAMRLRNGGLDPNTSGTFIAADGATQHLRREDFVLRPITTWKSKVTGGQYPIAWELSVPSLKLTARIATPVENQELVLTPVAYWEGLVDLTGTRDGREMRGHGYMELTGYAGALVGLAAGDP